MRRNPMEGVAKDVFSIRGQSQERKNMSLRAKSKSRGRSNSLGKSLRKCWKCGKVVHYKKCFIYNNVEKGRGFDDPPLTQTKTSTK
jgi:hypothetical protein